jgi:RNA polymerase sigma-70 factor (ECF subfamily)
MEPHGDEDLRADAELSRRVRAGDRQAFVEIVRRHQARLRSVLSFHCASANEAEELLQEAFVQAWTHFHQYDLDLPFFPWLRTIAVNLLRMEMRRKGTERGKASGYLRHLQMARAEEGDGSEAEERGSALRLCLEQLPRPQAELLVAKYREGKPLVELAGSLKTTEGALKVRLLRLREALRDCIVRRLSSAAEGA